MLESVCQTIMKNYKNLETVSVREKVMTAKLECIVECKNILGEVPLWDIQNQSLYWVDVEGKLLQRFDPEKKQIQTWTMPERIGSFALREQGGLIASFESGIALVELSPIQIEWIAKPESSERNIHFNEGKCDRKGRFWTASMDTSLNQHVGTLYRVDTDLSVHQILDRIGIPNCYVWNLENDRFWFADSMNKMIYDYDYNHEQETISNRRVFADLNPEG